MNSVRPARVLAPANGGDSDWSYIFAGAKISAGAAKGREKILQSEPDNLACRLELLGFYGARESGQDDYFGHLLWMIDNRPGDAVSFYLGHEYHCRFLQWTESRLRKASSHWALQVKKNPNDSRILCNAASYFSCCDSQMSDRLYKRAKKLDPRSALPSRRLAYAYRARAKTASAQDRGRLIRRALHEANDALKRKDTRGERVGILTEFTPTAIKFGHLQLANQFAERLRYYGQCFYVWDQYAYLNLAWLAFKENRPRALNLRLDRLYELFKDNPTHVPSCNAALTFVGDTISRGRKDLAERILTILITGEDDPTERCELEHWLQALRTGKEPTKLNLLKQRMSELF